MAPTERTSSCSTSWSMPVAPRRRMHIRRGLLLLDETRLHEFIAELEDVYSRYDIDSDDLDDAPDDVNVVATVSLVYPSARRIG